MTNLKIEKFLLSAGLTPEETEVSRQSYAGLLWSKQFYHYIINDWLIGDPEMPAPPTDRLNGRNSEAEWRQLFNRDVVSMPDKWEYPWVGLYCVHTRNRRLRERDSGREHVFSRVKLPLLVFGE